MDFLKLKTMLVKWLMRFLAYLGVMLFLAIAIAYITGYDYLIKGVRLSYLSGHTSANIYDASGFDTRKVDNGGFISSLPKSSVYNQIPLSDTLLAMLQKTHSTSFLVLQNDSIVWEYYYEEHKPDSRSNSFSMAKSITTMLVQQAIQAGKIPSWEAKAKAYLPWLQGEFADELTLRHLATMTAGLDWAESYYDPFGITARLYYGNNAEKTMKQVSVANKPGETYVYQSGATELLGLCLKNALGQPIGEFASEKLWKPMGAEMPATWHLDDEDGMELTYCCFSATTRDFARLGNLVLHHGYNSKQQSLVDSAFLDFARKPFKATWYGQSFWLGHTANIPWSSMQGTQGQYIVMVPESNMVIVRTGNKTIKNPNSKINLCLQTYVDGSIALLSKTRK